MGWSGGVLGWCCAGVVMCWCGGVLEWWCAGVICWCAGVLVWWCARVVVCWCDGVLVWWYAGVLEWRCAGVMVARNAVADGHCEIKRQYVAVRTDTPMTPVIPTLRNELFGAALAKGAGSRPAGCDILCLLRTRSNILMIGASLLSAINFVDVCSFPRQQTLDRNLRVDDI